MDTEPRSVECVVDIIMGLGVVRHIAARAARLRKCLQSFRADDDAVV
jgi:hypothetical protein